MVELEKREIRRRIEHYFHVVAAPTVGHSIDREHCWMCEAATYAVATQSKNQKVRGQHES